MPSTKAFFEQQADLQLGSKYVIQNLGTTLIIFIIGLAALTLVLICIPCGRGASRN